jgi:hypothetical protein
MTSNQELQASPAIAVFGTDESGKPHASSFSEADAELAEKAARLMGMQVLRLATDEQRQLAAKLPAGRVFASGRAFVPFVQAGVYEALRAFAGPASHSPAGDPSSARKGKPEAAPAHSGASPTEAAGAGERDAPKQPPGAIDIGTVVLALTEPTMGWWEAVVIKAKGDVLTLKWRDYPDEPQIVRRRHKVVRLEPA